MVIWDLSTGKAVHQIRGHVGAVTALDFSPNGDLLATGSRDTTALIWNLTPLRAALKAGQPSGRKK